MAALDAILNRLDQGRAAALDRLMEFLRIQSISTDPAYAPNVRAAADWLVADLASIGFDAQRHDTPGHPMVVATCDGPGPHLLFYGHYDVQPVDPLELWDRDPFDPAIEETPGGPVIRGRGTSDDKGQLMTFVEAVRAWKAETGAFPCKLTLFFEGEEESGSPSLIPFLEAHKEQLTADLALVCDTAQWDAVTPSISTSLRGMVGEEITITGPDKDLHSGYYGGPAMNPIRVLTRLLADLHDATGRVTLPGFYEGVEEVPAALKAQWQSLGFDADAFLAEVDLSVPAGEQGYSVLEQIWARPTAEVNGIWGGYTGAGFKTVLPSKASAKISFRLVGTQDPDKIRAAFRAHIEAGLPADCTVAYHSKDGSPAFSVDLSNPAFEQARAALTTEWGREAVFLGGGGSIPVVGHFKRILGMDSLMAGFGLADDAIHSPNEKYNLSSFEKGARSWVRILDAIR